MSTNKKMVIGAALAGLLFSGSAVYADSTGDKTTGECHGVNSCKGKGECGGEGHECAGKNSCKGHGWVKMSKADCAKKKGKYVASK